MRKIQGILVCVNLTMLSDSRKTMQKVLQNIFKTQSNQCGECQNTEFILHFLKLVFTFSAPDALTPITHTSPDLLSFVFRSDKINVFFMLIFWPLTPRAE